MPAALPTRIRKLYKKSWSEKAIASELCTQTSTVIRLLNKNKYSNRSIGYIKSCERKRKRFMNLDTIKISKINKTQLDFTPQFFIGVRDRNTPQALL
jgi:IS30 family transposase